MIRVLVVNRTRLMCSVLGAVLRSEEDIYVTGYATVVDEAIEKAEDVDVVLVDADMPDKGASLIAEAVSKKKHGAHVIVTGLEKTHDTILTLFEAGASGYVLKEVGLEDLLANVRAVHKEEAIAPPEIVAKLIARISELSELCVDQEGVLQQIETLTPREQEVMDYICDGLTNREIGEKLHIEVGTVKNHVHSILDKLDVSNRHKAAEVYQNHHNEAE